MTLKKAVRPAIVVGVVLLLMFISPGAGGYAAGKALALTLVWFVIKMYRPSWTAGWSGAWLFIAGVIAVFTPEPEMMCTTFEYNFSAGTRTCIEQKRFGPNPVSAGLVVSTVLVLPSMLVWKSGKWIRGLRRKE